MNQTSIVKGGSLRPLPQGTGLRVTHKIFLVRIPAQFAFQQNGDVAQVARGHRAMVGERIGDRELAFLQAFEEMPHMAARLRAAVELDDLLVEPGLVGLVMP